MRRWSAGFIRRPRSRPRNRGRGRTGCVANCGGQLTPQLLWEEHRVIHPEGHGYSRFCELYRAFEARLLPTMRQTNVAGERLIVDYAGAILAVIGSSTGAAKPTQKFVAALGATNYTMLI